MSEPVIFRKLHDDVLLPIRATFHSACADIQARLKPGVIVKQWSDSNEETLTLIARKDLAVTIRPGARMLIPTGWAVKLPIDYSMRIYSRSGLVLKSGIAVANGVGIIDSDYRHEVFVMLTNLSSRWQTISDGMRIAQFDYIKRAILDDMLLKTTDAEWFETDLDRKGGFGSTGK